MKIKKNTNQHYVGCWIDLETKERVDKYCENNNTFISEVLRAGIEELLKDN